MNHKHSIASWESSESFFEAAAVNMNESLNDLHRSGAALGQKSHWNCSLGSAEHWGHHDQAPQEISSTTELWKSQAWLQKWNYLQTNWTNINTNKTFREHRFGFMMFHVILSQVPVEGGSWLSRTGNAREFNEHPGSDEIEKSQVKECKAHHGPTYIAGVWWVNTRTILQIKVRFRINLIKWWMFCSQVNLYVSKVVPLYLVQGDDAVLWHSMTSTHLAEFTIVYLFTSYDYH